jgi:hypothetical protein
LTKVNLKDLVQAELARRAEASSTLLPFTYTTHDEPGAMTDVQTAVSAVEEEHAARVRGEMRTAPTIAAGIAGAVEDALAAAHPKHFARLGRLSIVAHVIVDARTRHAPVPDVVKDAGPSSVAGRLDDDETEARQHAQEDAADRAARRIAAMRGLN